MDAAELEELTRSFASWTNADLGARIAEGPGAFSDRQAWEALCKEAARRHVNPTPVTITERGVVVPSINTFTAEPVFRLLCAAQEADPDDLALIDGWNAFVRLCLLPAAQEDNGASFQCTVNRGSDPFFLLRLTRQVTDRPLIVPLIDRLADRLKGIALAVAADALDGRLVGPVVPVDLPSFADAATLAGKPRTRCVVVEFAFSEPTDDLENVEVWSDEFQDITLFLQYVESLEVFQLGTERVPLSWSCVYVDDPNEPDAAPREEG